MPEQYITFSMPRPAASFLMDLIRRATSKGLVAPEEFGLGSDVFESLRHGVITDMPTVITGVDPAAPGGDKTIINEPPADPQASEVP